MYIVTFLPIHSCGCSEMSRHCFLASIPLALPLFLASSSAMILEPWGEGHEVYMFPVVTNILESLLFSVP